MRNDEFAYIFPVSANEHGIAWAIAVCDGLARDGDVVTKLLLQVATSREVMRLSTWALRRRAQMDFSWPLSNRSQVLRGVGLIFAVI